ncbi:TPA: tyrosine-type recombinase/integrase [Streptococcus pyogenes]|nr:tyrosine-type recombinase/integrase [Streptococcus pyogenes]
MKIYGDYHTHLFRHSHISFLAEKGIPLNAIMDRVGHSDPKTTLSIYSHTTVNMKEIINKQTDPFKTGIKQKAFDVKAFSVTIMTPAGIYYYCTQWFTIVQVLI